MNEMLADFLLVYARWFLAGHVIAVLFWMAGMYYLPRLFVYHCEAIEIGAPDATVDIFKTMERKLLRIIMNPAMIAAWIFALLLIFRDGFLPGIGYWFWVKLFAVILMTGFHMYLASMRRRLEKGETHPTSGFFRKINEIPPILTIIIVVMVIVRPF